MFSWGLWGCGSVLYASDLSAFFDGFSWSPQSSPVRNSWLLCFSPLTKLVSYCMPCHFLLVASPFSVLAIWNDFFLCSGFPPRVISSPDSVLKRCSCSLLLVGSGRPLARLLYRAGLLCSPCLPVLSAGTTMEITRIQVTLPSCIPTRPASSSIARCASQLLFVPSAPLFLVRQLIWWLFTWDSVPDTRWRSQNHTLWNHIVLLLFTTISLHFQSILNDFV